MDNYILNGEAHGFIAISIEDIERDNIENANIVIVFDANIPSKSVDIYRALRNAILKRNRLIALFLPSSKEKNLIQALMCIYKSYDIYKLNVKSDITENYLNKLLERKPTYEEIEEFVSSRASAYGEIGDILLEIDTLIAKGDRERLIDYLEQNARSLEDITSIIDSMKACVEVVNSGEHRAELNKVQANFNNAVSDMARLKKLNEDFNTKTLDLKNEVDTIKKQLANEKEKLASLSSQANIGGHTTITAYPEIQTAQLKCKAKSIIYFKEVSSVPFINTLVVTLVKALTAMKIKNKLVVYDNATSFASTYKPLTMLSSADYARDTDTVVNKLDRVVMCEPNTGFTHQVLEADYQVLIIYDRLKKQEPIVSGNNVYTYWVINSSREIKEISALKKIEPQDIITREGSSMTKCLCIPRIDKFSDQTEEAQSRAYHQLKTSSGVLLMPSIITKTNIKQIAGK